MARPALAVPALEPIRLQLQYYHQFQFAGFYAAKFTGLYERAGLDVQILESHPGGAPVANVLAGDAEFGVSDTEVLARRLAGAPLLALGVVFQNSAYSFVTLDSSNIFTIEDFKGRRVGITTRRGEPLLKALLAKAGLPSDSYVRVEPQWSMQSLIDRQVDVTGAYATGELYLLRERHLSFHVIYPFDYGIDFYGDTLYTTTSYQMRHPDTVERFRQASFAGWRYAFDHLEETLDYIMTLPSIKTRGVSRDRLRFEATMMRHLILPDLIEPGSMNVVQWEKMAATLLDNDPSKQLEFANIKGFVYQSPRARRTVVYQYAGVFAGVGCLLLGLSLLWVMQLRKAVRQRTAQLDALVVLADQRSQEAKAANAAKSLFLGSISHEFRTPLTAILGFSELLQNTLLGAQQSNWLGIIQKRAVDLLALVNQVLEYIQLDGRPAASLQTDFNLKQEVQAIADAFMPLLREKHTELAVDVESGLPATVHGPGLALRQVLINLLGNAVKFTPAGGHVVVSCARLSPQQPDMYVFAVHDDGPGVPTALGQAVFEPFRQGSEGPRNKSAGTGLGLAISKKLVTAMGGEIWYSNHAGRGCTFSFTARLPAVSGKAPAPPQPLRVLIVDDDCHNRELIQIHLSRAGIATREAATGQEALDWSARERFDFILMDLGLPDIDGVETATRILSADGSRNRRTPIAALTASAADRDRERSLTAGMCAFLTKPINFATLLQTIQTRCQQVSD